MRESGYLFSFMTVFNLLSILTVSVLKIDKRFILFIGLQLFFIALMLLGPVIYDSWVLVVASLPVLGYSIGFCNGNCLFSSYITSNDRFCNQ